MGQKSLRFRARTLDASALHDVDSGGAPAGGAEKALRECEERYRSLFEHSPDGILVANFDGIYTEANAAACRLLGRSRDEVIGLSIVDTLAPDEIPRLWQAREELARGGVQVREWTLRRKDGSDLPVEISAKILRDGRWQAFVRDISERRRVERAEARGGPDVIHDVTSPKEATDEQRLWSERLSSIISIAADAIISIDDEQGIVVYNQGAAAIFGWSEREALGRPITMLIPERLRTVHEDHVAEFRSGGTKSRAIGERGREIIGLRKSGEEFPAEAAISRIEVGGSRLSTIILRDISERRRMEEALRVSEERLKLALKASPSITLFHQDDQLRYTWIHNASAGFSNEGSLGKTDFDVLKREEAEELTQLKRGVLETGVGAHAVVHVTEGSHRSYFDLTIEPIRDNQGRITGITGVSWDVTEHRRIEDEQRLLAEFGATLMLSAPSYDATLAEIARLALREFADWFVADVIQDGRPQRVKVECADPTKRALAEALEGSPLDGERSDLLTEALRERRAALITDVRSGDLEKAAQGSEHVAWLRTLGVRSLIAVPLVSHERLIGAFAFLISREGRNYGPSDLRFAEELARIAALAIDNAELHRKTQRAIAARDDVMGIVAHDLRNPLNSVLLQSEILRRAGAPTEWNRDSPTNAIRRSVQQMSRLIQDMLDVARLEGGTLAVERRPLPGRSLLDDVKIMQREAVEVADLHIRIDAPDDLPDVLADRGRLFQVFGNLIGNAIKFAGPGGEIVLGAKPTAEGMLFWATDTGPGIPAEQLPHLFDRFWQAKKTDRRGAGLGLSIVKGLVEAHGGRIWVESRVGEGTTFYFTVPLAPPPEADDAS